MQELSISQKQNRISASNETNSTSQDRLTPINISTSAPPYLPHITEFENRQMNHFSQMHPMPPLPHISQLHFASQMQFPHQLAPPVNEMTQMNPQMVDHRLGTLEQENMYSSMNEGYLSPASAIAQGWTPQIVYVPSPMIHMIPSPMPTSMIPSPSMPSMNHLIPEAIARFEHNNAGLGLLNPEVNAENQEVVQSSFEDMLSSLGLLPPKNKDTKGLDPNFQKSMAVKGKNLYKCPWEDCGKTFTRPYNLKSHYRGHTGERPFVCQICTLGFARKHDLKRHVKVHDGLKSFSCPFCRKCFTRSDALKRHLKNAIPGKESSCGAKQEYLMRVEAAASSSRD